MNKPVELVKVAIDNNDPDLALMLVAANALHGRISAHVGMDNMRFAANNDAMLSIIFEKYPNVHHCIQSFEIPVEFSYDLMVADE